jgi:hypothetical protein
VILRWAARLLSLASIGVLLLFLVGEGVDAAKVAPQEWVGLALFPFGVMLGLALGWWREGLGGGIAVGSLLAFYAWYAQAGGPPRGWAFLVFTLPGFLYLASWLLARRAAA